MYGCRILSQMKRRLNCCRLYIWKPYSFSQEIDTLSLGPFFFPCIVRRFLGRMLLNRYTLSTIPARMNETIIFDAPAEKNGSSHDITGKREAFSIKYNTVNTRNTIPLPQAIIIPNSFFCLKAIKKIFPIKIPNKAAIKITAADPKCTARKVTM